jgi:hypothetical protein
MPNFSQLYGVPNTGVGGQIMSLIYGLLVSWAVIIFACLFGAITAYIILKIERRPWPYSWQFAGRRPDHLPSKQQDALSPTPSLLRPESAEFVRSGIRPISIRLAGTPAVSPAQLLARLPQTELVAEIESNLSTARAHQKDTFIPFQTRVLEVEHSRSDSLRPDVQKVMRAAYTDMRLANTLIRLFSANQNERPEFYSSYAGLCRTISERLEQLTISLVSSGHRAPSS